MGLLHPDSIVPKYSTAGQFTGGMQAPIHDQHYKYVVGPDTVLNHLSEKIGAPAPDVGSHWKQAATAPEPVLPGPAPEPNQNNNYS